MTTESWVLVVLIAMIIFLTGFWVGKDAQKSEENKFLEDMERESKNRKDR